MTGVLLAQATGDALPWWVFAPSIVMLGFVVITAPIWPYSRGWGWAVAGMSGVGLKLLVILPVLLGGGLFFYALHRRNRAERRQDKDDDTT